MRTNHLQVSKLPAGRHSLSNQPYQVPAHRGQAANPHPQARWELTCGLRWHGSAMDKEISRKAPRATLRSQIVPTYSPQ